MSPHFYQSESRQGRAQPHHRLAVRLSLLCMRSGSFNPAAESQAIDRTHRLRQFKPIQATHFIIAGSIEDRILQLQDKKRLIFDATVGGNVGSLTRLTIEDLRFLFSSEWNVLRVD